MPADNLESSGRIEQQRRSLALQHFFDAMRDCQGMEILDLGEFSEANRDFVTGLGHRLYSEDIAGKIDQVFGAGDPAVTQRRPDLAHEFLSQSLQFDNGQFDAIFVWDTLEYAARPLLDAIVSRLLALLRNRGNAIAYFHADTRLDTVANYAFRVLDFDLLELHSRGTRRPAQLFTNRGIEKLFERFGSTKFYLTRDALREVLIRK